MKTLVLVLVLIAPMAFAAELNNQNCGQLKGDIITNYCVDAPENNTEGVLYYFHGLTGSEKSWGSGKNKEIRDEMKRLGLAQPTVITISFGSVWLLAEKNESSKSGLLELVMNRVIPQLESQIFTKEIQKRWILGESMGGFNAAQIYLRRPDLFKAAMLFCPAMATISPLASKKDVDEYIDRTHASPFFVHKAQDIAKSYFPSVEAWSHGDPLGLANQMMNDKFSPLYVSCDTNDVYGFCEGADLFYKIAKDRGISAEWTTVDGGHCVIDPASIAKFLAKHQ